MDRQLTAVQGYSRYEVVREEAATETELVEIVVKVLEETNDPETAHTLFAKVVVTASDGSHPDGSGSGVYADGRFFYENRSLPSLVATGKMGMQTRPA